MLIRQAQMDVFRQNALHTFANEMERHIRKCFPGHYATIGAEAVQKIIQYGLQRAKQYDFDTKRSVAIYLNTMILLGSNFDLDPQYPWAQMVVHNTSYSSQRNKSDDLSNSTLKFISKHKRYG